MIGQQMSAIERQLLSSARINVFKCLLSATSGCLTHWFREQTVSLINFVAV